MAQTKKKQTELDKQLLLEQEALKQLQIQDRFIGASDAYLAAEDIIDQLSNNGGMHLYEKYLQTKDTSHCSYRLIQFFEEGVQFSFFPGDPGEEEETFDDNWTADQEPDCAEIDHWATRIVKTKQVLKVENQIDDAPSSVRSKRAPSIASSRKTFKMRSTQQRTLTAANNNNGRLDSEQKSKQGDSVRDKSERKENLLNITLKESMIQSQPQYLLIPLDVEPPREIPEEEKLLRDRKEKQLKMKELEMKEQREKEERERQRLRSKLDAFAEIEKSEYTYDHNGKIIMVKKPNLQRVPGSQLAQPDIQLHGDTIQSTHSKSDNKVPLKSRTRLQSAKQQVQKEIKPKVDIRNEESIIQEKAELELQENYDKLFNPQELSLRDYGLQKDPLNVQAGIVLTDKEGRRTKGPNIPRENQMTLQEYQKVAQQFEIMNDDKLSKHGSQKKLLSNEAIVTQLDEIQEDEDSIEIVGRKSQERIKKKLGADEVYDREMSINEYKTQLKAKRKDLKSANVKNVNEKVLERHNKEARITSAKQQQDVRIRRTPSKLGVKERIYNYENHIGGHDIQSNHFGSQISDIRPSSGMMPLSQSKRNLLIGNKQNQAESLIDEFNKKLLDKGTDQIILPIELPKAKEYLIKRQERPMTSKPISMTKNKITVNQISDAMAMHQQSVLGASAGRFTQLNKQDENVSIFNNKTLLQKKAPRERIISAKLPREQDKLPPPPFGKTMGHGLISKQIK